MSGGFLMLSASVPEGTQAPIGVNVDSGMILDALEDGTVFDVEILAIPRTWRHGDPAPKPMSAIRSGSIVIADPTPRIQVDQPSLRFTTDNQGWLHIQIDPADAGTRWVALSAGCFALLNESFLAGFVVHIPRSHRFRPSM